MKFPRLRIGSLMGIVAIVAVDIGLMRLYATEGSPDEMARQIILVGSVAMANVLAVSWLIGGWDRRPGSFLKGFLISGTFAISAYVALATLFAFSVVFPYLQVVMNPLVERFGRPIGLIGHLPYFVLKVTMLVVPQLIIAVVGGLIYREYRSRRDLVADRERAGQSRFATRWGIIALAMIAVTAGLWSLGQRRKAEYLRRFARHATLATNDPRAGSMSPELAAHRLGYHKSQAEKYRRAALRPLLSIPPDLPEPE